MKKNILILVHESLIPPENITTADEYAPWITEWDVSQAIKTLGHNQLVIGIGSDLKIVSDAIENFRPHIVFNLLEEFDGNPLFDQNVVSYLELLGIPYTGCNPRGLILARDKALAKQILKYHRIPTPGFEVYPKGQIRPKGTHVYPLMAKCLHEEASFGISKASVVHSPEKLQERIQYIHQQLGDDAIVERFIEGREFFVPIMGKNRLTHFPVWELIFENSKGPEKEIYSERAKWSASYREKKGIRTQRAKISSELEKKIIHLSKRTYKALHLSGHARIDLRVTNDEKIFIIEANPNPNIAKNDEFALSAKASGLSYPQLIHKIIQSA